VVYDKRQLQLPRHVSTSISGCNFHNTLLHLKQATLLEVPAPMSLVWSSETPRTAACANHPCSTPSFGLKRLQSQRRAQSWIVLAASLA
jgi:hypothetical protein